MEQFILPPIRRFCSKLASDSNPLDMADWCSYLTFDVMGELCLRKTFGMLEKEEHRGVLGLTINTGKLALIVSSLSNFQAVRSHC
jgi:hypothetical protein